MPWNKNKHFHTTSASHPILSYPCPSLPSVSPPPRVEALSEADVSAGGGGDEDHAWVAPRLVEREKDGLADGVIFGVDAQQGAPYVREVAAARPISVVVLKHGTG